MEKAKFSEGMVFRFNPEWSEGGHTFTVKEIIGGEALIIERSVSVYTGEYEDQEFRAEIELDYMGDEVIKLSCFTLRAGYYEDDEDDYYTPSATHGDYGPSNPWDAPGMSIRDFI